MYSYKLPRITLFIACYNEEKYIIKTLDSLKDAIRATNISHEIIVVDDCSTDKSLDLIKKFILNNSELNIFFIKNKYNKGLAANYIDTAIIAKGEYFRLICGDNAEDTATMITIFNCISKADIIAPYYTKVPGKENSRLLISYIYTCIINLITGNHIKYYNGCGVFKTKDVVRWAPHSYGFGFQADLISRLISLGRTVYQVEIIPWHAKKHGSASPLHIRNLLSVIHTISELIIRRVKQLLF